MTTRPRLDRQLKPGFDDTASDARDDIAVRGGQARARARADEPSGSSLAGSDRGSPATPLPGDWPNRAAGHAREAAHADPQPALVGSGSGARRHEHDGAAQCHIHAADDAADPGALPESTSIRAEQATSDKQTDSRVTDEERTGVDARRRGWFWHWNNVVTQYAPLIGLKGVGLLNSYTVWTDRRDESPHRGYAFPSQQSEADFYGEERSELITINKILVALDLIEIRKEMLTRVDERGRRWRVPHNLYRVKDRPGGVDLRASNVKCVAILAKSDETVFRYVRRVFSDRFKPIDGDNVWHTILNELRDDPIWRELQERTRAIEARASARTRAGHQSRTNASAAKAQAAPEVAPEVASTAAGAMDAGLDSIRSGLALLSDTQQVDASSSPTSTGVASANTGSHPANRTVVDRTNTASAIAVAGANQGSATHQPSIAAGSNGGRDRVVGPGNTTYDQTDLTTTTTTTSRPNSAMVGNQPTGTAGLTWPSTDSIPNGDLVDRRVAGHTQVVADVDQAPAATGSRSNGSRANREQMNQRNASEGVAGVDEGAENKRDRRVGTGEMATGQQLDERTERGGDEQRATGARAGGGAGERRLADPTAGGPLVDPGPLVISTFEAANDRRVTPLERHLLAELERDADPPARAVGSTGADWVVAAMREAVSSGSAFVAPKRIREIIARWSTDSRHAPSSAPPLTHAPLNGSQPATALESEFADVRLPGGVSGNAVWASVLDDLSRALDRETRDRLLAGSRVTRYWRGAVEVAAASSAAADKLSNEYRGLVERHLNSRLRRPVTVRFVVDPSAPETGGPAPEPDEQPASDAPQPLVIAEAEVEIGRQVWQSLLGDLARVVTPADLDRLAGVIVLGQDAAGGILLGTPSPLARRLLDGRYRANVESSLAALLGQPSPVRVLDSSGWTVAGRE